MKSFIKESQTKLHVCNYLKEILNIRLYFPSFIGSIRISLYCLDLFKVMIFSVE